MSALSAIHHPDLPTSGSEFKPKTHLQAETSRASSASSPGSVSQRLENIRRWLPDEQLNEKIGRHMGHLEETSNRNNLLGYLEQPLGIGAAGHTTVPTVKVRKVAQAPPAPVYKGELTRKEW